MGEITRCRIVTLLAQVIDGAMQASGQRSLQLRPGWSRCLCDETRPSRPSKCRGCRLASPAPGGLVTNLTLESCEHVPAKQLSARTCAQDCL